MSLDAWSRNTKLLWILGLSGTTALMIWMLLTETLFLNVSLIIFFAAAKYLGGLGVVIGILSLSILILEKAPDKFQGKENKSKLKLFYQFMIITPIILLVYGIYKTIRSYILQQNVNNLFDIALFLFGIISLIVTMYIIPIYKDNYESVVITTTADMLKSMVQDTKRTLKKRVFLLKKDYGQAQMQDQMEMKDQLELWRRRVAAFLLILLAVGAFVFTPFCLILIVFWVRVYFSNNRALFKYEKVLVLIALVGILVLICLFLFIVQMTEVYEHIRHYYFILELCHFLGALTGSIAYYSKFMAITYTKFKLKERGRQLKDLRHREKSIGKELKQKEKNFEKEMKLKEKAYAKEMKLKEKEHVKELKLKEKEAIQGTSDKKNDEMEKPKKKWKFKSRAEKSAEKIEKQKNRWKFKEPVENKNIEIEETKEKGKGKGKAPENKPAEIIEKPKSRGKVKGPSEKPTNEKELKQDTKGKSKGKGSEVKPIEETEKPKEKKSYFKKK